MKTFLMSKLGELLMGDEKKQLPAQEEAQNQKDQTAADTTPSAKGLLYEVDECFNEYYTLGMQLSDTPDSGNKRKERFYNLQQLMQQTLKLEGDMVECGCWKGLSSFLLCHTLQRNKFSFQGEGYHILDSFEGLSDPTPEDVIELPIVHNGKSRTGKPFKPKGGYAARLEHVKEVLKDFPHITYHAGWIPDSLDGYPERRYRFVHVDVDLHQPTLGAVEYFYPRLVPGGILVCDDYGSLFWPGAKKAIDDFCIRNGLRSLALSTGQAVLWKH